MGASNVTRMRYSGPTHFVGVLFVAMGLGRPHGAGLQERISEGRGGRRLAGFGRATQSAISSWVARFQSTGLDVFGTSPWRCFHRSYASIWRSLIEASRTWS